MGIRLVADLALSHRVALQTGFWVFIDNQPSIRALTQPLRASPGLSLRRQAVEALVKLASASPSSSVTLVWCPAHVGIPENEEVDQAAKDATVTGRPLELPVSLAAVKQLINLKCKDSICKQPTPPIVRRLQGTHNPTQVRKALSAQPRHSATAIAQLRAGHTPLSAFLHRIRATDDPNCQDCGQPETTAHYLLLCQRYTSQRKTLFRDLHSLHLHCRTQTILTDPRAFKPLAEYISATKRFSQAREWCPPLSQL